MKKLLLTTSAACFALLLCQSAWAGNEYSHPNRGCWTMENMEQMKKQDPGLEVRMAKIESDMQVCIKNNANTLKTQAVVTIPVVFHILWKC